MFYKSTLYYPFMSAVADIFGNIFQSEGYFIEDLKEKY